MEQYKDTPVSELHELEYEPLFTPEESRRQIALTAAIELLGDQMMVDVDEVMSDARKIEEYLKNG